MIYFVGVGRIIMQKVLDLKDWQNRYKNHGFDDLVIQICKKHNIECKNIENIYCLENVIFKVDNKIIKIYNPLVLSKQKQYSEVIGYKRANKLNLSVPKGIITGEIAGDDICYYLIMDYIEGKSLKNINLSYKELAKLSFIIRDFLLKYNGKPTKGDLTKMRTDCDKFKWELISDGLASDFKAVYNSIDFSDICYVHADLHKGNIMKTKNGRLLIIDFGDNKLAPWQCELPPIICNLFKFDNKLLTNVFNKNLETLKEELIKGFIINDFGTDYLEDLCNYLDFGNIKNIKNLEHLKVLIDQAFANGGFINN